MGAERPYMVRTVGNTCVIVPKGKVTAETNPKDRFCVVTTAAALERDTCLLIDYDYYSHSDVIDPKEHGWILGGKASNRYNSRFNLQVKQRASGVPNAAALPSFHSFHSCQRDADKSVWRL